jgi:hypothetical protein
MPLEQMLKTGSLLRPPSNLGGGVGVLSDGCDLAGRACGGPEIAGGGDGISDG